MQIKQINDRLFLIRTAKAIENDDEKANKLESQLYKDFIKYITLNGTKHQRSLANIVLKSSK